MPDRIDDFLPTRQSLLSRLKDWDDQESWREFFDLYGRLIYGLAVKSGLSDAEAQDVVQETLLTVAKKMPGFQYNPAIGSFKGWLLTITRRRIADEFGRRKKQQGASVAEAQGLDLPSPLADAGESPLEAIWDEEWRRHLWEAAVNRVKRRVTPKQFQMFDLYVRQQWAMAQVTSTLSVNAAQVYMARMRVGRLIEKEVKALETRMV